MARYNINYTIVTGNGDSDYSHWEWQLKSQMATIVDGVDKALGGSTALCCITGRHGSILKF